MNKPIKRHPIKKVGRSEETISGKNETLKTIKATQIKTIFMPFFSNKKAHQMGSFALSWS